MKCSDLQRFVDLYLDDEFDERDRLEVEAHLSTCDECRQQVEIARLLRKRVRECAAAKAPEALRGKILESLSEAEGAATLRPRKVRIAALAIAATALIGLVAGALVSNDEATWPNLTGDVGNALAAPSEEPPNQVVEESLDWHRRRLPVEVTGPRPEEIRTWFAGKVDFPVRVPSFHEGNAALLGGRLAQVGQHRAALLTLVVNQRKLSMMVFPRKDLLPQRAEKLPRLQMRTASGYNVAILEDGDVAYSFVSDMPKRELRRLVHTANLH